MAPFVVQFNNQVHLYQHYIVGFAVPLVDNQIDFKTLPPFRAFYSVCRRFLRRHSTQSRLRMIKNPSVNRNQGPILECLKLILDKDTPNLRALEISSGTGQHVTYFSSRFPNIHFQPSEYNESMFSSILAYKANFKSQNVADPIKIDVTVPYTEWPVDGEGRSFEEQSKSFDYIFNINMIHITPIECTEGLFRNSAKLLKVGRHLITYGPYAIDGVISPESNVRFDAMLKSQDPRWGVRDLGALKKLANYFGIECTTIFDLPSNNKCVVWTRTC